MRLWEFVSRRLILVSLVGLLCGGCVVVPVPLPGVKSGRAVSEKTPGSLEPGAPFADVILQLGEPDSVSADGRTIVYRFSRTWGALVVATLNNSGAAPFVYSEAIVATFDEEFRLLKIERRGGKWASSYGKEGAPVDARVFGHAIFESGMPLGDEKANVCWKSSIWTSSTAPLDAGLVESLREWRPRANSSLSLWVTGQAALSDTTIWFRRDFASGTADSDTQSMPLNCIKEIAAIDSGTERPCVALRSSTGCTWLLEIPAETDANAASLSAVREWFAKGGFDLRVDGCGAAVTVLREGLEGWPCTVVWLAGRGFGRHSETRTGMLWIADDGMRFVGRGDEEDIEELRYVPWSSIVQVKGPSFLNNGCRIWLIDGREFSFFRFDLDEYVAGAQPYPVGSSRMILDAVMRHKTATK